MSLIAPYIWTPEDSEVFNSHRNSKISEVKEREDTQYKLKNPPYE